MNKTERETMEALKAHLLDKQNEVARLSDDVKRLRADYDSLKMQETKSRDRAAHAENKLEAAHALVDGLPMMLPRTTTEVGLSFESKSVPLVTRLASWIARGIK